MHGTLGLLSLGIRVVKWHPMCREHPVKNYKRLLRRLRQRQENSVQTISSSGSDELLLTVVLQDFCS